MPKLQTPKLPNHAGFHAYGGKYITQLSVASSSSASSTSVTTSATIYSLEI
ncbi:MAG: hypothetical protein RXO32_11830 [Thermoproteus sp.]